MKAGHVIIPCFKMRNTVETKKLPKIPKNITASMVQRIPKCVLEPRAYFQARRKLETKLIVTTKIQKREKRKKIGKSEYLNGYSRTIVQ